jgi:hypothetical protein
MAPFEFTDVSAPAEPYPRDYFRDSWTDSSPALLPWAPDMCGSDLSEAARFFWLIDWFVFLLLLFPGPTKLLGLGAAFPANLAFFSWLVALDREFAASLLLLTATSEA